MTQLLQIDSKANAIELIKKRNLSFVKVGCFDNDGVMLGKYMATDKFISALSSGFSFCDVVLGWDCQDRVCENLRLTGWHTGFSDAPMVIVPETAREIPFEHNTLLFLAEFSGDAARLCSRNLLRRVVLRAEQMGFSVLAACEYEFFLFNETPDSIRKKDYRNLQPFTPDSFGYSIIRNSVHSELYHEIFNLARDMNFPVESLHTETGPGVLEAALQVDEIRQAADKAALFKTFMKVLAERNQLMATFMARWSEDQPGQSGHIHVSLRYLDDDRSAFYDESQTYNMSKIQRHFVAGQVKLMPEFLALLAPTINSYRRLQPGYWAPTQASWGVDNRTCALRVIPGSDKSQRVEYRAGAADANPYLALAATLASGLYGIEHELEPGEPVLGNAYDLEVPQEQCLPASLFEAAQQLKASKVARDYFGDDFVEHYAATREWEENEYRKHVSDWELKRYFEII